VGKILYLEEETMKLQRKVTQGNFSSALIGLGMIVAPLSASALTIDINTYVTGSVTAANATVAT